MQGWPHQRSGPTAYAEPFPSLWPPESCLLGADLHLYLGPSLCLASLADTRTFCPQLPKSRTAPSGFLTGVTLSWMTRMVIFHLLTCTGISSLLYYLCKKSLQVMTQACPKSTQALGTSMGFLRTRDSGGFFTLTWIFRDSYIRKWWGIESLVSW